MFVNYKTCEFQWYERCSYDIVHLHACSKKVFFSNTPSTQGVADWLNQEDNKLDQ